MTDSEMYICRYGTMEEVWDYMRRSKLALWMARAERAKALVQLDMEGHWDYIVSQEAQGKAPRAELDRWYAGWNYAERKCREMADRYRHE